MFDTKCSLYYAAGNPKPKHKATIEEGDMEKLTKYFRNWHESPQVLMHAAWFHLCYYFGRRGREGWITMTKDTFTFQKDSEGHNYVAFAVTETTKNHQGGYKQCDTDYSDQRMYGPGVDILRFYLKKLNPANPRLFQHSLAAYKLNEHWFRNEPIGKNAITNMMSNMSKCAGLSTVYTNHCVRATTVTALYCAGVPVQSIMAITKHKNPSSFTHYVSDISNAQKRSCADALTATFHDATQRPVPSTSGAVKPRSLPDEEVPAQFDLSFPTDDMEEEASVSVVQERGVLAVALPAAAPEGSIFNVTIPPPSVGLPLANQPTPISLTSIFGSGTFNNCHINVQFQPK